MLERADPSASSGDRMGRRRLMLRGCVPAVLEAALDAAALFSQLHIPTLMRGAAPVRCYLPRPSA